MFDRRRYLGTFAVFALVLLRLAVGWHFFREGTQKIEYDRRDGKVRLAFTSESFLNQATGPLAALYRSKAPENHGWRELLATPRRKEPPTEDEADERVRWKGADDRRRADATKKGELAPIEFPPSAAYREWANRIADDWRATLERFSRIPGLMEEQKQQAKQALHTRLQQVKDYLAGEEDAIAEYRHELWRLETWRGRPETGALPFHDQRIATKAAETNPKPTAWVNQIKSFEADYHGDLRGLLTNEQRELALTTAAVDNALADPREKNLRTLDIIVTALTIGVGVCLLLGFFTRLSSLAGALFLLAVIASQPPWLSHAAPTMPQVIEFAGLLVLAGTGAGRWAGLDFFTYALFRRWKG